MALSRFHFCIVFFTLAQTLLISDCFAEQRHFKKLITLSRMKSTVKLEFRSQDFAQNVQQAVI